ncbi:hypothetical protein BY458DRAFT_495482, partial [Sporodiniella umbellata]
MQVKTGKFNTSILLGTEDSKDNSKYFLKMFSLAQTQYNKIKDKYKNHDISLFYYEVSMNDNSFRKFISNRSNILINGPRGVEKNDYDTDIMLIFEKYINEENKVDEIQKLYDFDNQDNKAKSEYALVIASGSSSDVEAKVFKRDNYGILYSEFPNLNNSVFKINRIEPIRDQNAIKRFLDKVYEENYIDDINKLFLYTGGIPGIPNNVLEDLFIRHDIKTITKVVYDYRDKDKYFKENITNLQLASLEGTFFGWENTPSPGHLNEELIRKCMFTNQDYLTVDLS